MADFPLLKNMIDTALVRQIAERITIVWADFAAEDFVAAVAAKLPELELKARFVLIADQLRAFLPADYPVALAILLEILDDEKWGLAPIDDVGFRLLSIPTFVERHGVGHPRESLGAMYIITRYASCESAIRPFILQHPELTMETLQRWAGDSNAHVRRLVSEGSRTRLPWAAQLKGFIADPAPALALLEQLKDDPSLYVRRSVANNLNDICKDHPQLVLERMEAWKVGASAERLWLINHALRTLVKRGDARALAILGYGPPRVELRGLRLEPRVLHYGNALSFSFELCSLGEEAQELMIDYALHFVKANGKTAPKVFKLKKMRLEAGKSVPIEKKHAIRPISTRRYYAGTQRLEIQVNGRILGAGDFELVMERR